MNRKLKNNTLIIIQVLLYLVNPKLMSEPPRSYHKIIMLLCREETAQLIFASQLKGAAKVPDQIRLS